MIFQKAPARRGAAQAGPKSFISAKMLGIFITHLHRLLSRAGWPRGNLGGNNEPPTLLTHGRPGSTDRATDNVALEVGEGSCNINKPLITAGHAANFSC